MAVAGGGELVGVYSRDQRRAEAFAQKHDACAEYSQLGGLLGDSRVDGVFVCSFPQLSQARITAALIYYACYRDEVQAKIDANAALTPEAIEKQYPGLICFTR